MRLYTPDSLLYPITVTQLLRRSGDELEINAPLFVYEYKVFEKQYDDFERREKDVERRGFSNFESEIEGRLTSLDVKVGQVISRRTTVGEIEEACRHEVQFGGICADCGKDLTLTNTYNTTISDVSRATVNTVHGRTELLISQSEASKADEEAKQRLLKSRRLSLVVDLDQTIIHATVDPTVAEWQRDESNPNHQAVKDVRAFQLADDAPGFRNTWYYIKLRPGLRGFLESMSGLYELHIYTMGTRAYAENIAKIIDPDRKLFGDRVLSRDESGSQSAKNLKRLFPVDTKMVVIIDDRADVWHWIPNLVKVPLYDFFVGIGDINSSFLPKRQEATENQRREVISPKATEEERGGQNDLKGAASSKDSMHVQAPKLLSTNGDAIIHQMVSMAGNKDADSSLKEQDETIAAQLEDRPLLQKQKLLEAAEEEEEAKASPAAEAAAEILAENGGTREEAFIESAHANRYRHNLLQDDDTELDHLGQNLRKIHDAYFEEYDKDEAGLKGGRVAELRPGHTKKRSIDELAYIPDVAPIMDSLKSKVLAGVNIVFSGVIPLGNDIQTYDTSLWAKTFGATISENVTKRTTHVIASPDRRTAKVRAAAKHPRIAIVSPAWLSACFGAWRKVNEDTYRIHVDAPANGAGGLPDGLGGKEYLLSSSDEEAAQTEDDTEDGTPPPNGIQQGLSIDTVVDTDTELESHMPSLDRQDSSPTEAEHADAWGDIDEEFREFMGSDDEEDSGSESVDSQSSTQTTLSQRKRKRGEDGEGDADATDDAATTSRLQKRKREALARTTSLTNVAAASNGSSPRAMIEEEGEEDDPGGGEEDIESLDEEALEAALAAEMERQSEEGDLD